MFAAQLQFSTNQDWVRFLCIHTRNVATPGQTARAARRLVLCTHGSPVPVLAILTPLAYALDSFSIEYTLGVQPSRL
jgi:hypothetical protein